MGRAIRAVSTERGYDLARFALFAFGGAGPLHAIDVARECGIPRVVIPIEPGTMCARGMLLADVSFDFVRSLIAAAGEGSWPVVMGLFHEMQQEASAWLQRERVADADRRFRRYIDARYEGQNFEVVVEVEASEPNAAAAFLENFAAAHRREYGYDIPGKPVEIVNCRLQAVGRVPKAPLSDCTPVASVLPQAGQRSVYFGKDLGWVEVPIHARSALDAGHAIEGPAIIEEMSSTVVLAPGQRAAVDRIGNLVVDV
jgi:N-methylhydantoinase A